MASDPTETYVNHQVFIERLKAIIIKYRENNRNQVISNASTTRTNSNKERLYEGVGQQIRKIWTLLDNRQLLIVAFEL